MKIKRIAILPALALGLWLTAGAAGTLTVTDGTRSIDFPLESKPSVTFDASEVTVTAGTATVSFPIDHSISFSWDADSSLGEVTAESTNETFKLLPGAVMLGGLQPGSDVGAWSLKGELQQATKAGADGSATLALPQGVTMISTTNRTFKVIIK